MRMLADPSYKEFLSTVKHRIQQSQLQAAIKVNQELLLLYRTIGKQILQVQDKSER